MAKFKIGDKVVANAKAGERYRITVPGTEWYVIEDPVPDAQLKLDYDADLMVAPEKDCHLGFRVRSECFDLARSEFDPERIIRNGDAMIVLWRDGTKTVVKRSNGELDSDYAAFTAALAIKAFGSNTALKKMIEKKLEHQRKKPKKMRFSVGDTVKTKDTLVCGAMYDGFTFGSDMMTECSEVVRIDDSDGTYKLSNGYWYPARMLESATLEAVTDEDDKE